MTQPEESRRLLPESSPVKIMEKASLTLVVDNFPRRKGIGIGKSVESSPFTVGGYSFTILLYPDGDDEECHCVGFISLYIKNDSPTTAHLVYALEILHRGGTVLPFGQSSFHERNTYHLVDTLLPGSMLGCSNFIKDSLIRRYHGPNDSVWIRATVGVVLDRDHEQQLPIAKSSIPSSSFERHRCILFQVGDKRFFENESLITRQCPALISDYPQSDHTIVISDLDDQVFMALLYYFNNNAMAQVDVQAIMNPDGLFAVKMLAAAQKFHLKVLAIQICNLLVVFGHFHVLYQYSEIDDSVKELWRKVWSWVPQKMKAA